MWWIEDIKPNFKGRIVFAVAMMLFIVIVLFGADPTWAYSIGSSSSGSSVIFSATASSAGVPEEFVVERLPGQAGSWTAMVIVFASTLIAWALNYESHAVRTIGTLLSSLGCFALVIWFVVVWQTGIVDNPKPIELPFDAAKPTLLKIQAAIAAIGGFLLLLVAYWQSKRIDRLDLPMTNTPDRYGRFSRYLHWTTAILFLSLIPVGIFTTMIPEDVWFRNGYYVVHKTIGLLVFGLVLIRIFWNIRSKRPKLDDSLNRWERGLAHSVHGSLYIFMLAFPVTGFVMSTYAGRAAHLFFWDFPLLWAQDLEAIVPWGFMHKFLLPYLFFIFFGAHLLGALKHQFIDGHDNAFRRIVS